MKNKKLIETIDVDELLDTGAIFTKIASTTDQPFTWLTQTLGKQLDEDYYLSHSGEKRISSYFQRLLDLEEKEKIDDVLQHIANHIITKYTDKWNKLYSAFIDSEYNPLENYSMHQVETPNITKDAVVKVNTDVTTHTDSGSDASTYGFNSATPVPTGSAEADSDVNVTGSKDNNYTDSLEHETGTRSLDRSGNIGVTTSQQMLQSEIDIRNNYNFIDAIMKDVDNEICLLVY